MGTMRRMRAVVMMFAAIGLLAGAVQAAPITVPNAGFEVRGTYDPIPEGENKYPRPAQEFWRYFEAGGNGGPATIVNPPSTAIATAAGGDYIVRVVTDPRPWVLDIGPTAGVAQLLTETFDPTKTYTLTSQVARYVSDDRWNGYVVQLAVGGVNDTPGGQYSGQVIGGTVIAEDWNTQSVPSAAEVADEWVTSTVVYTPDPADAALEGEPLQIRLLAIRDPDDPAYTFQDGDTVNWDYYKYAAYDNVTLDAVEGGQPLSDIPEPATMALLGLAACGLGGYVRRRRKA